MTKFMIVDGNSIGCRAALAFNPKLGKEDLKSKSGVPTGAVHRFFNLFIKLLNQFKPTHIAFAWDTDIHTFRKQLDASYKANRQQKLDDSVTDMNRQFQIIRLLLEKLGIHSVNVQGFEGDDIIGSFIRISKADNNFIITGDRDSFQLVDDNTFVVFPKHGFKEFNIVNKQYIQNNYELDVNQFIDLKMLQGDMSDNIRGIDGCGPKMAIKLLHKFGSIDNIKEASIEEIQKESNKRVAANIEEWKSRVNILKQLVTIRQDIKLPYTFDDCKIDQLYWEEILSYIEELDMNQLSAKIRIGNLYLQGDEQLSLW